MYTYLLIASLFAVMLIALLVFRNDILHPCVVICVMFLFSSICMLYNVKAWDVSLSLETYLLIIISLLCIILGGVFAQYSKLRKLRIGKNKKKTFTVLQDKYIDIEMWKIIVICIIGGFATLVYFREVQRIARVNGFGGGSWTVLMNIYRNASHFNSDDVESSASFLAATSYQVFRVAASLIGYILANNIAIRGKKGFELRYIIPIILYFVCSLLTGGRMPLLRFLFMLLTCYYVVKNRNNNWKHKTTISTFAKVGAIAIFAMYIFSQLRGLVGRTNDADFLSYITMYGGGSIVLLDLFLKNPIAPSMIWGKETFAPVITFLGKRLHIPNWVYLSTKEFRRSNGVTVGNVYTALRSPYYDFGFVGCLLFCFCIGWMFARIYKTLKKCDIGNVIDMKLMLYSYISYSIFLFSINNYFDFISFNFVKLIVFFFILRYFLVSLNIHNGSVHTTHKSQTD